MAQPDASRGQPVASPPPLFGRFGPGPRPPGEVQRARNVRRTVRRLWGYLQHYRAVLLLTAGLVVATTVLNVVGPYLLARAMDRYVIPRDLTGLDRLCLLMLGVYASSAVLTWLQSYLMAGAAQRAIRDLRNDLFAKLQVLPLRFFDQQQHGDLMSRLTNDIENVNQALSDGLVQIVSGLLGTIGVAAAMLSLNWRLALVSLVSVTGISLGLNRWVMPRMRTGFRRQQAAVGTLNGLIEETVTGQRVVKACHREATVITQFDVANHDLRRAATHAQIFAGFMGPMMNCVNNIGLTVVAGVGGWMTVKGLATVGILAGFISYTRQFGQPLNELANVYGSLQSAVAGAERVFAVMDEPPEVDAPDARPLPPITGDLVFEHVDFAYTPGVPVLRDVSFHAQPGQIVALVGPTGAGKTTVVNLLTRFYEIDRGRITVDGHDLTQLRKEDLRRQLGIVLQDMFLFAGSVLENIRYGRPPATDTEVMAAARMANAEQFIHRLPDGYATVLAERGSNLSQGQRQLLAIARAILADPRILILDEATSSVDTRTEAHLQEAMRRLMAGRTSLVIAHRLGTIREADQILVLHQGEIVERGTHTELVAPQGFYAGLYASQFAARGAVGSSTTASAPPGPQKLPVVRPVT